MSYTKSVPKILLVSIILIIKGSLLYSQNIGLQLYSLRNEFKISVPATLVKIKNWNIHELEGGGTYGLPKDEYINLLKENNLKMVSVGADFQDLATNPRKAIDEAKSFGSKYIVCFWIPHNGDQFTIEDVKKAIEVFNSAGKIIRESGLSLCYHPHGYEFLPFENGTMFDYLIKNTDPNYINFEVDVFWIKQPGQDPVALMKKYPNRFTMLHLKDRRIGTIGNQFGRAEDSSNVVLGQGDVGIAAIMREAKKIGIKHYFIEDESPSSVSQIPLSLDYLRSLKK